MWRAIADLRAARRRCDLITQLEMDLGERLQAQIIDLSDSGAFLATDADLQVGDTGRITIGLPGGDPWLVEFTVTRLGTSQLEIRHPRLDHIAVLRQGAGIQFGDISPEDLGRLRDFLDLLDER